MGITGREWQVLGALIAFRLTCRRRRRLADVWTREKDAFRTAREKILSETIWMDVGVVVVVHHHSSSSSPCSKVVAGPNTENLPQHANKQRAAGRHSHTGSVENTGADNAGADE